MKGMSSSGIQSAEKDCSCLHVGLYCWKPCNLTHGKVVYYKMACDVCRAGQHGYFGICALTALTIFLLLSANRATVAADQLPPPVSGVPILPPYEATFYPPLPPNKALKCDRMFISNPNGPRNGSFYSPNLTNSKDPGPHQCIYTFIANPTERVKIIFTSFNLTGAPPECIHEYLDLYTEVPSPEADLISTPFGGRYCGRIPPRQRISLFRILVISFYSDQENVDRDFHGTYEFINAERYSIGTLIPNTSCSFNISSQVKRDGEFLSPTYPGVYPKNLVCSYNFRGDKGQRVRIEFLDFDLFFGGAHCPFDHVKIYDGTNSDAPLIGTYCGQRRNLVAYSSGEELFIQFTTLQRTADTQNRGFSGLFEFSERYVSLNFIGNNGVEHIKGSECDQKILSKKESNGTVVSPNYPFIYHQNTICRYFIYGLQDVQNLEHVKIEFEKFEIPTMDESCTDTYLKLYLRGQEDIPAYDKPDHAICGRTLPPVIVSEGPRLVMVFSSGTSQGQGFKARYAFETEFLIPGTQAPDRSCQFTYLSTSSKSGDFNSPRFPSNYPSNITCTYMLKGNRDEHVRIVFDQFNVDPLNVTAKHGSGCQRDWVELYNIYPDDSSQLVGRYCGSSAPGPIISEMGSNSIKIILNTDKEGVASGFKLRYFFETRGSVFGDCGANITGLEYGVISSPSYPEQYAARSQACNWYIYVKPRHRVLLQFQDFTVEGDPTSRGCPSATVRVWKDVFAIPVELCGAALADEEKALISDGSIMRFTFITADKAVGAKGFQAVWTEIKEGPHCDLFYCKISGFCIPTSLCCNGVPNCGYGDNSDESNCDETEEVNMYLLVGLVVGVTVVILLGICMWCHRKHKRRRRHPRPPENRMSHSCEVPGARFSSMDSV